jgi:FkbM family methyltransferase
MQDIQEDTQDNSIVSFLKNDQEISFTRKSLNTCSSKKTYEWFLISYSTWEPETFDVFDKYLDENKIFIDLGGWIGTTCIYAANKSKHVYVVEADPYSVEGLKDNCDVNKLKNITVIGQPIFNVDDIDIKFGKNIFTKCNWNESMSQIITNDKISENDYVLLKSITLKKIIENNNIDLNNVSLIKVDIEGGEENIMDELLELNRKYKIPLWLSFHIGWWKDKNYKRFNFDDYIIKELEKNLFSSILIK